LSIEAIIQYLRRKGMSRAKLPSPAPPEPGGSPLTWLADIIRQGRLAWKLLWDNRVPLWTKLIPPATLAYLIFPADILPDFALGLGQLDDLAILLLGTKLFIELSPIDIVREHLVELGAHVKGWQVKEDETPKIIDGDYNSVETEEIEDAEIVEETDTL
jgi:hypothetical protein